MKTLNTDSKGDIFQPTKGTEATALTHQFTPYLKSQDDTYSTLRVHYHNIPCQYQTIKLNGE